MILRVQTACRDDIPALERLIEASVRGLQRHDYSPDQIEASLNMVFGVDRQLVDDQSYFLVKNKGEIVGCGGWSRRRTLFGADAMADRDGTELRPGEDAAKIRAFFVHPGWARRGIGTWLLKTCEDAAAAAGFKRLELAATLTGEPLYARYGYLATERLDVVLDGGRIHLPTVKMTKTLGEAHGPAPLA